MNSPVSDASVVQPRSLISPMVIDNLIVEDLYKQSVIARTLSFTVLPIKHTKMAAKMHELHISGWEKCWREASKRWLAQQESKKTGDDIFSPLYFMRKD